LIILAAMQQASKYIDIREIIRQKNPTLMRWLPFFVLNYIKRILHEDEINVFMAEHGHTNGLDFVHKIIEVFGVQVELQGAENIRNTGGVIYAANHPLGGLDAIAFMHMLGAHRSDMKFLVNDILTNIKNLEPLFVPVNKHGNQGRSAIQALDQTLQSQEALLVFPAGLVSRKQPHGIADLEWKKTFVSQSKRYQKDVIPVYIEGRNSAFFYNLANLRKTLGVKANLEMFYLADEMFAQKGKKIVIHVGKPIPYSFFDKSKSDKDWADYVKTLVYKLAP
jgi:putative hemolysin